MRGLMRCFIRSASVLQTVIEKLYATANYVRRSYIVPIAHYGERDMHLLTNGQWVDSSVGADPALTTWRYDSAKRHLIHTKAPVDTRMIRSPLIAVTSHAQSDLSDFFCRLRISDKQRITGNDLISLFVHQKGFLPALPLACITRNSTEIFIGMSDEPIAW